jgi:hypothetical protein
VEKIKIDLKVVFRMAMKRTFSVLALTLVVVFGLATVGMAQWGSKELDTEKIAVNFAREAERGGYKIVTTEELKGWIDEKKNTLIIDTILRQL